MKTRHVIGVFVTLIAIPVVASAAWHLFDEERPPANAQPLSALIKKVEDAGYKTIVEVEFDDGVYEVEALNATGKEVDLKVDPVSGAVATQ